MSRTQHHRQTPRTVDDGRFDTDRAGAAIENQRNTLAELFGNMRRGRRADPPETIGGRRRWLAQVA